MKTIIGAYPDAGQAVENPFALPEGRRVAVLPHDAADEAARRRLREAGIEGIVTLRGEGLARARWLAHELAAVQGWDLLDAEPMAHGKTGCADIIGWYEVRVAHGEAQVTADRPITRLHGGRNYIASFNLLGQGRLNRVLG